MEERNYPIKYKVTYSDFNFSDSLLREEDAGGCDGLIIHSLSFSDGGRNETITSLGPDNKPLESPELFMSWVNMAEGMSQDLSLPQKARDLCYRVVLLVKDALKKERDQNGNI